MGIPKIGEDCMFDRVTWGSDVKATSVAGFTNPLLRSYPFVCSHICHTRSGEQGVNTMATTRIPLPRRMTTAEPTKVGKEKTMVTRETKNRVALGDITKKSQNVAAASDLPGKTKLGKGQMVTRQAKRLSDAVEKLKEIALTPQKLVLPEGVKDIDALGLDDNPQLCSEYAFEMYIYLKQREPLTAVRAGHLDAAPSNAKMRACVVDWLVEVSLQFTLMNESLFAAVSFMDRYIASEGKRVPRQKLQLVGAASLFLASKVEEIMPPMCSDFAYITDSAYTEKQFKQMEIDILRVLNFDLFEPLSLHFLRRFSKAGDVDVLQHGLAKYILEVSLLEYPLVPVPKSKIAAAALFLSLHLLHEGEDKEELWNPTLVFYSGYKKEEIIPVVSAQAAAVFKLTTEMKKTKAERKGKDVMDAIGRKYKSKKLLGVADLADLEGEKIKKMIEMANI